MARCGSACARAAWSASTSRHWPCQSRSALDGCAGTLGFTDESLWVALDDQRTAHVDPVARAVTAVVDIGPADGAPFMATGDGSVWVPVTTATVARIDTATDTVTEILDLGRTGQAAGLSVGHDSLWAGDYNQDHRAPHRRPVADDLGSVDRRSHRAGVNPGGMLLPTRQEAARDAERNGSAMRTDIATLPSATNSNGFLASTGRAAPTTSPARSGRRPNFTTRTHDWRNPDLFWPDDRRWFIATDVDFWSLYIGGSKQLHRRNRRSRTHTFRTRRARSCARDRGLITARAGSQWSSHRSGSMSDIRSTGQRPSRAHISTRRITGARRRQALGTAPMRRYVDRG